MPRGTYKINADLKPLMVRISTLKEDPDNERDHDHKNLRAIAAAIDKFGQQSPIVVLRKSGIVKKGNGTLIACRDLLKWTHIARVRFDDDDPVAIKAYGITDNRTGELATWKLQPLQASLMTVQESGAFDLDALGWDEHDLGPILAANWNPAGLSDDKIEVYETVRFTVEQYNVIEEICREENKDGALAETILEICKAHRTCA